MPDLAPGAPVRVAMTKWGDVPHWSFEAVYLGADQHGDWIGIDSGTVMTRPGARFVNETDQVCLVPRSGAGGGAGWLATFHAPGYLARTYVDMTSVPVWDGATVRAIDLDLDVIRLSDGNVYVDDEDEFDEHRRRYDYPREVVDLARSSCEFVLSAVLDEDAPFDGSTSDRWLRVLTELRPA